LLKLGKKDVDARDKRGHDDGECDSIAKEKTPIASEVESRAIGKGEYASF
jgi:hypothetical protein